MVKNYKKGELAKTILKGLVISGLIVVAMGGRPSISQVIRLFKAAGSSERRRMRKAIKRLRDKKLVTITYKGNKELIQITERGRKRVLEYDLDDLRIKKPAKWDGYWRMVTFDIPNTKKKARDAVNMKLKDMGFVPFQKSIFISPYGAKDEVDFLGEHFMVRRDIKYIVAKRVDGEAELKKKFGLH